MSYLVKCFTLLDKILLMPYPGLTEKFRIDLWSFKEVPIQKGTQDYLSSKRRQRETGEERNLWEIIRDVRKNEGS